MNNNPHPIKQKAVAYCRLPENPVEQKAALNKLTRYFSDCIFEHEDYLVNIYAEKGKPPVRSELHRLVEDAKQGRFQRIYIEDPAQLTRSYQKFVCLALELAQYGVKFRILNTKEGTCDITEFE